MNTEWDASYAAFPLWIELSGLPAALNEKQKGGAAWWLFRKIIELDIERNRARPGLVEITPAELCERAAIDPTKLDKCVKVLRKMGLLRAFLPDDEGEAALFQILTPLPTPKSCNEVRAAYPDYFLDGEWPPRYSFAVAEVTPESATDRENKTKRVVDLYLNTLSMKLNSLVVDQLQLIADRYEMELIEKVFARAKKREARSLGWILSEIRRETKILAKAEEIRQQEP